MNKVKTFFSQLLDIPTTDPDDARRRKLLNVLLAFMVAFTSAAMLASLIVTATGLGPPPPNVVLSYLSIPAALLGAAILFAVNRYWSGQVAGWIFLFLLTASAFAEPELATSGKMLLVFAIPIVIASFLLRPYASFLIAGLISLLIAVVRISVLHAGLDVSLIPTFFLIALVSWIAARSLENALISLRVLNRELDRRVAERTQELAKALEREQNEASKNQAILEGIADGVIVFDRTGKAIIANPAVTGLLGRSAEGITGYDIEAFMGDGVDVDDREAIVNLLRDGETAHSGLKFQWDDKTLSVSLAPVRDASGQVIGTVTVFRDFTREAEIDRMKSTFVSIASHELRTPLNAILGYGEMLREGVYGSLSDKQQDAVGRIVARTGQLLGLANNLLDQAQMEAGRLTLHITSFAPGDLIADVQGVMDVLARARGLELTSHIAEAVPKTIHGDRQRLHQILVNLIGNAIKFTDEGRVSVSAYIPAEGYWALKVSDTGGGIPPEARSYIFEPFRQVDGSATRSYGGAGMGLSIVKQLVSLMGGEIRLESKVKQGSTFTVVLPLVPPADEGLEQVQGIPS